MGEPPAAVGRAARRRVSAVKWLKDKLAKTMKWLKRWLQKEDPACAKCGQALQLATIPLISGAHEQVAVIFRGLPYLSCAAEGHPRQFAVADFGVYVIDAVFWRGHVPLGRPGPLAKVKCYECGKNLSKVETRASEVAGLLNIADLPEFGIRIKGPVATCPRCETDQLWATREVGGHVSSAIVEAFKQAGL